MSPSPVQNKDKMTVDSLNDYNDKLSRIRPFIFKYCKSRIFSYQDAEDVCQNVICILNDAKPTYEPKKSFWSWAFCITRFQIMGFLKKMSRSKEHVSIDFEQDIAEDSFLYSLRRKEEVMPFSGILNKELQDQQSEELKNGIETLAPKEKTLFLLSLEGKSKEFIMESMNIKERNYFGLKRRAIIKMRNVINSNMEMERYN
jgi:RNA polymerase sigma factor (sigma-70 family)